MGNNLNSPDFGTSNFNLAFAFKLVPDVRPAEIKY